jgi:hypothetical protein
MRCIATMACRPRTTKRHGGTGPWKGAHMAPYVYVCMYVCMYYAQKIRMYVWQSATGGLVWKGAHMAPYVYECMYACMYACMYVYTHIHVCVCV